MKAVTTTRWGVEEEDEDDCDKDEYGAYVTACFEEVESHTDADDDDGGDDDDGVDDDDSDEEGGDDNDEV
jgi:hypothetical protein